MGIGTFSLAFNRFMTVLTTPLLAGPHHCNVHSAEQTLTVRMGLRGWAFKADVPRASILEAVPKLTLSLDDPAGFIAALHLAEA